MTAHLCHCGYPWNPKLSYMYPDGSRCIVRKFHFHNMVTHEVVWPEEKSQCTKNSTS
jgi:hypothetical protein